MKNHHHPGLEPKVQFQPNQKKNMAEEKVLQATAVTLRVYKSQQKKLLKRGNKNKVDLS